MNSRAAQHFPTVVHLNGERVLWNRLEKKPLENRPEERVRLRFIDYLNLECGWPASRIASEVAVSNQKANHDFRKKKRRADLICYNTQLQPEILIECKAESVKLDTRTAAQAARYNHELGTRTICITNGLTDFWYSVSDKSITRLDSPPLTSNNRLDDIRSELKYWQDRGFAGKVINGNMAEWLTGLLAFFWSDHLTWVRRYLTFPQQLSYLQFNQYYRIAHSDEYDSLKTAFGFLCGLDRKSYLTVIFNRDGENRVVLVCDLEKLLTGMPLESSLYTSGAEKKLNLLDFIPDEFLDYPEKVFTELPGYLNNIMLKYG